MKKVVYIGLISGVAMLLVLTVIAIGSTCTYISANNVTGVDPSEIPKWISEHYSTNELCGYFTPDGYFANFFEMDAYYRWKYPEIYDPRILDIAFYGKDCNPHSGNSVGCEINMTFMEWYWSDPDTVRQWLRDKWGYPDDWRVLIPVSMKIYYDSGEDVKALDSEVAITEELIREANSEYSSCPCSASLGDPIAVPPSPVDLNLIAGVLPAFYQKVADNFTAVFGGYGGFAPHVKSLLDQILDFLASIRDWFAGILGLWK